MDKIKKSMRPLKVNITLDAPAAHRGEVRKFGTGGAHIIFSKDYLDYEVLVIPLRRIENGKTG